MKKLTVLIVEDNFDDMEYCTRLLEAMPIETVLLRTGNSKDALQMMTKAHIDLVLVDVMLPDMDGFRLVQAMTKMREYQLLKIIFITGRKEDQLNAFKQLHCYDYITKPFSQKSFQRKVEPLLQALLQQKEDTAPVRRERHVYVETRNKAILLKYHSIFYVETTGRKMRIITSNGAIEGIPMTVNEFVKQVNHEMFQKCHLSYAVNVENISKIERRSGRLWDIYFTKGVFCPLSKTYYDKIRNALQQKNQ